MADYPSNIAPIYGRNPFGGTYLIKEGSGTAPSAPSVPNQIGNLTPNYDVYNQAVSQQAKDYGFIMDQYGNIASSAKAPGQTVNPTPISPQNYTYAPSANVTQALSALSNLTQTGGYSASDIQNLRARAVSPIRSVYSSANEQIDRNRVLRGSSTAYGSTKAKLARDMAQQISDANINANASIADSQARNRVASAPAYASAAGAESALSNQYGRMNTDTANDFSKFNANLPLEAAKINQGANATALDAVKGMASLYGTTPALAALYGSQAMQSADMQNRFNQQGRQQAGSVIGDIVRSLG